MAQLSPGYSFATNEFVTPTKFHNYVDDSFLVNVKTTDLSGCRLIYGTTPGTPATGDVRVGSDGRLEFYYSGVWNTQPADELTLTLTNKSGSDLVLGDVVVWDHANSASFTIASLNPAPDVCGVLAANIANNASGLVYVRGVVQCRVANGSGGSAGQILRGPNGTSATAAIKVAGTPSTDMRSDAFGIILEVVSAIPPTDVTTCYIWK